MTSMLAHAGHSLSEAGLSSPGETDLQKYLKTSSDDQKDHSPLSTKDTPSTPNNVESYFNPRGLSRAESIFSFSRASFSDQLSSLTSMNLPSSESLSASMTAIPTAPKATQALAHAADQIQKWAGKAITILENLDADDDVEWAAAAGREGLDETDKAVRKFETLVEVYIRAIDELQMRPDIGEVRPQELQGVVDQMESTLADWDRVKGSLSRVHDQVELAMEWEELWGTVLGDVGEEMENLRRLVFEMEEKRHMSMREDAKNEGGEGIDLNELENFLHDSPRRSKTLDSNTLALPSGLGASPLTSPAFETTTGDSNLLSLFARMQPLRASLDFLPMRLSMFQTRGERIFPTICKELEERRARLEKGWKTLETEAENLRRELGEDRWVLVFRNAGRQAGKMCESVERSITRLQEAIEIGTQQTNASTMAKRVESFEAKRMHYGPAIDRVLAIIQKGVKDRVTVNGQVIRLHIDMSARVQAMHQSMKIMQEMLDVADANHNSQLRDSISSIITMDLSTSESFNDTPSSSPASSVVVTGGIYDMTPPEASQGYRSTSSSRPPPSYHSRFPSSGQHRRPATPLASRSANLGSARARSLSQGPQSRYKQGVYYPPAAPRPRPAPTPVTGRPRWSSSGKAGEPIGVSSARPPSRAATPSTIGRPFTTPRSSSSISSTLTAASPLSRETTVSPVVARQGGARRASQLRSFTERVYKPTEAARTSNPSTLHSGRNITAPARPSSSHANTIRSPSALAVSNRSSSSIRRPLSTLPHHRSTSKAPHSSSTARLPMENHGSDISGDEVDCDMDEDPDDERYASPSMRPKLTSRPGSVAGRRLSMLPVVAGSKSTGPGLTPSGRESSLGSRPAWK